MIRLELPPSHHNKDKQARKDWQQRTKLLLSAMLEFERSPQYELVIDFYGPWVRPSGKHDRQMPDIDRMATRLIDLVAEAGGFNDRQIHRLILNKWQSTERYCLLWLRPWTLPLPGR